MGFLWATIEMEFSWTVVKVWENTIPLILADTVPLDEYNDLFWLGKQR